MRSSSTPEVTVFCLHYLGGSAREWREVAAHLDPSISLVPFDLPGFGKEGMTPGFSLEAMARLVEAAIAKAPPKRWMLVGHSMGAKVATVLASWQRDGKLAADGLIGLVLLAGSPPSPEPMSDEKRSTMSSWFRGDVDMSVNEAERYVADNVGTPLDPALRQLAVDDALACNQAAWIAWLQQGSREDWAARVGVLQIPCLIVTGSSDQGLGREPQRKYMAPHFADLQMVDLKDAGHLLPLERPAEVARLIAGHAARGLSPQATPGGSMQRYLDLIGSDRVGQGTRDALLRRMTWQATGAGFFNQAQRQTLACLLEQVLPRCSSRLDLARRLEDQLTSSQGDGWRFAVLPTDQSAYALGLDTLETAAQKIFSKCFIDLDPSRLDYLLNEAANGTLCVALASGEALLDAMQMKAWFEDVRGDATKLYMSHPETLARVGYSGIANGGDGLPKSGFIRIGIGEKEAWEPDAAEQPS